MSYYRKNQRDFREKNKAIAIKGKNQPHHLSIHFTKIAHERVFLDWLAYELYGLTEEEIGVVEVRK